MKRSGTTGSNAGSGSWRAQRGFSMAEVLVVVALIAVIVLAILPAFGDFAKAYRVRTSADEMLGAIRGVRQMAITMRQDLTITFTPAPANTYSYYHPIQNKTVTVKLPERISVATNPTGSYAPVIRMNGSVSSPSAPSVSAPTSNFVRLTSVINSGRTDIYTFGFSAAGQVTYTVTH